MRTTTYKYRHKPLAVCELFGISFKTPETGAVVRDCRKVISEKNLIKNLIRREKQGLRKSDDLKALDKVR
jgi:hypothetical protein